MAPCGQHLHFVTVASADLDAARRFYTALDWVPLLDVEGEITFYQTARGQLLGFFAADKFNEDLALPGDPRPCPRPQRAHLGDRP